MTMPAQSAATRESGFWVTYAQVVRSMVFALEVVAALGILTMMAVTCTEVVLRIFRVPIKGTVDLVSVCAAISAAAAMPYTTACKGHVAIEFLFQKLSRPGRIIVDSICRTCIFLLFGFLAVEFVSYGVDLKARGQVTPTLQMPEFWVPYVLAVSCAVVCLVKIYHLFHPGKELIKP